MGRVRKNGVQTPYLILVDELNRRIVMELIENAVPVKTFIQYVNDYTNPCRLDIYAEYFCRYRRTGSRNWESCGTNA